MTSPECRDRLGLPPIPPPDQNAAAAAADRQAELLKPAGSLGRLETLAVQIAGLRGEARPSLPHKLVLVFAADHGVAGDGVSAYPAAVTAQMLTSFEQGVAAVNVLARQVGADLLVVDVGVAGERPGGRGGGGVGVVRDRRLRPGTASFLAGQAMTRAETEAAIRLGAEVAAEQVERGVDLVALGEIGIGNTAAAAALAAALLGLPAAATVGPGTGVAGPVLDRKRAIVQAALDRHRPDPADPIGLLAAVGGLELAALVGAMLRATAARRPVVLDGFPVAAAALVAAGLDPAVRPYLIAAHRSPEPGHRLALEALGLEPLLDLGLRLGEASGAALALPLIDAALAVHAGMATFAEAGVAGPTAIDVGRADHEVLDRAAVARP